MDSITQAALGACVAHACWHKEYGKKSFTAGAVLGTLPDLDIVAFPFLNDIQRVYWHRGESHSLFFIIFAAIFLSIILKKYGFFKKLHFKNLSTGIFLILATHILIDYFTIYGTQIFAPFSKYGFARGNIFIIDPLYTIPLLAGIFGTLFFKTKSYKINYFGILISSIYMTFSLISHGYADFAFKQNLNNKNIKVLKAFTTPTPMNTILWRHIALTDKGIVLGYFSIISGNLKSEIDFELIPKNEELVAKYKNQNNFKAINWFSKGFWTAKKQNNKLIISDIRFGEIRSAVNETPEDWQYLFSWIIDENKNQLKRNSPKIKSLKPTFNFLFKKFNK